MAIENLVPEIISLSVCNTVTIIGCIWMWRSCKKLNRDLSRRLFPRQFKQLALSDFLTAVGSLINMLMEYTTFPSSFDSQWGTAFCDVGLITLGVGLNGTTLAVTHIVISFVCAHFRWKDALTILSRPILHCTWYAVGSAIAVTSVLVYSQFDPVRKICIGAHTAYLETIFIIAVFAFVLLVYLFLVVGMLTRRKSPNIVRNKIWKRALVYPLIFFITNSLMTALFWSPKVFLNNRFLFAFAICMQSLNGVLNFLAYWINSKHRDCCIRDSSGDADNPEALPESMAEDLLGILSFHVVFASTAESIPASSRDFSASTSSPILSVEAHSPAHYPDTC